MSCTVALVQLGMMSSWRPSSRAHEPKDRFDFFFSGTNGHDTFSSDSFYMYISIRYIVLFCETKYFLRPNLFVILGVHFYVQVRGLFNEFGHTGSPGS